MSDLVKKLRLGVEGEYGDYSVWRNNEAMDYAADRIEHLERVLMQAREAMEALDLLFRPLARDCTAMVWIDKNSAAIAAIDEALNTTDEPRPGVGSI